jgi:hypothetical protein
MLNMFQAPLCPSSGAQDYIPLFTTWNVCFLVWIGVRCGMAGYVAGLAAAAVQLLMKGIEVPETY